MDIDRIKQLAGIQEAGPDPLAQEIQDIVDMIDEADARIQKLAPQLEMREHELYDLHNRLQYVIDSIRTTNS